MDCIPYINDLQVEIEILKDVVENGNCDIILVKKQISEKEIIIQKCKENLCKLSSNNIEYRIYRYILDGLNVSKAISKVAEENYLDGIKPSSEIAIYKYHYPKLKKLLMYSESIVN